MVIARRRFIGGALALTGQGALTGQSAFAAQSPIPRARPARSSAFSLNVAPPRGRSGWVLMDALTGEVLDAHNDDQPFIPASVTKSVTSFLTLSAFRPEARFVTQLFATGPIENGTIKGDLHLIGGGDPALDTADLADLAAKLKAKGVRRITGRFFYNGSALPEVASLNERQPMQAGYNPGISGLNLNFNRVLMKWRQHNGRLALASTAFADSRSVPAKSVTFRSSAAQIYEHGILGQRELWTIPSRSLRKAGQRWFPVRRPAAYAAEVFRSLCIESGITLPAGQATAETPAGDEIAIHRSDVAFGLLMKMMKYSNNLTAETLGMASARRLMREPDSLTDAGALSADWLRGDGNALDPVKDTGFVMENHSGLSIRSRMTPMQLANVLRVAHERYGSGFINLHSKGDLKIPRGTTLPQHSFWSKTGTMHFVRSLAGFLEVDGRKAIFVLMNVEDDFRAATDASFRPYDESTPRGARRWLRSALKFENELLSHWVSRELKF